MLLDHKGGGLMQGGGGGHPIQQNNYFPAQKSYPLR